MYFDTTFILNFRLEKMSGRFDRTNFVCGIETFFGFITYILKSNCEDKSFSDLVISEVCMLYVYVKMY